MISLFKKWGNWTDLSIGKHDDEAYYLLQGRRSSDGKVQFRVEKNLWNCYAAPSITLEDLQKIIKPTENA